MGSFPRELVLLFGETSGVSSDQLSSLFYIYCQWVTKGRIHEQLPSFLKRFKDHQRKAGKDQDVLESFTRECNPEFPARWQQIMLGSSKRGIMVPACHNQNWGSAGLSYHGQWLVIDNCCGVTEPMPLKIGDRLLFWSEQLISYYTD